VTHSPSPLQIATKIHFFLLRELGQGIDVERMLTHRRYERDVLLVCDACKGTELATLALQYREVRALYRRLEHREAALATAGGPPTEWPRESTGFGASRPLESASLDSRPLDIAATESRPMLTTDMPPPVDGAGRRGWLQRWLQR